MTRGPNRLKGMATFLRLNFRPPETTEGFRALHVQTAKQELNRVLNEDHPSNFIRYVDGIANVPEENVKFGGRIRYNYSYLRDIIELAMDVILINSPVDHENSDGRNVHYQDNHVVLVNGQEIDWRGSQGMSGLGWRSPQALDNIPADAEVWITNLLPYARKIEMNFRGYYVSSGVYEKAYMALRKYANVASIKFTWAEYPGMSVGPMSRSGKRGDLAKSMRYPTLIIRPL